MYIRLSYQNTDLLKRLLNVKHTGVFTYIHEYVQLYIERKTLTATNKNLRQHLSKYILYFPAVPSTDVCVVLITPPLPITRERVKQNVANSIYPYPPAQRALVIKPESHY